MVTTHSYLSNDEVKHIDRLVTFSRREIFLRPESLRYKYTFLPLPADGDFQDLYPAEYEAPYVFSGGGAGRDFRTLIEAVRGLPVNLKIVTFSPRSLAYSGDIPHNCQVKWRMPLKAFLSYLAGSLFVVVPLRHGEFPHGHTTIVQAIRAGKAVVTNQDASADDYIEHGGNGLLVPAGNVDACRQAILELWQNVDLRRSFEYAAYARASELTYASYARSLSRLCLEELQ